MSTPTSTSTTTKIEKNNNSLPLHLPDQKVSVINTIPRGRRRTVLNVDTTSGYYRHIDKCADKSINDNISNDNAVNAAHIITRIIGSASKTVDVYSGSLTQYSNIEPNIGSPVYAYHDLGVVLMQFLEKINQDGSYNKVRIIVDENLDVDDGQDFNSHPIISLFKDLQNNNHRKSKMDIIVKKKKRGSSMDGHFIVADGLAFRYELDHIKHSAVANFGDKKMGAKLQSYFDDIFKSSDTEIIYEYKD